MTHAQCFNPEKTNGMELPLEFQRPFLTILERQSFIVHEKAYQFEAMAKKARLCENSWLPDDFPLHNGDVPYLMKLGGCL